MYENKDGQRYFSPWEYVKPLLEEKTETEEDFRNGMGLSRLNFDMFKWGLYRVTDEMAKRLEEWSGVGSKTWLNLQNSYDEKQ